MADLTTPAVALGVGLAATLGGALLLIAGNQVAPAAAGSAVVVFSIGAVIIARHWRAARFGMANVVTLMRLVGTSWVAALTVQALTVQALAVQALPVRASTVDLGVPAEATMVVLGVTCLILDGVDGRLARSRGLVSAFGARFDMETDAALLLVLSLAVAALDVAGWWVLAIGGMRYGYVALSWLLPKLKVPLYFSYARKVVAVIQGVALLLALALSMLGAPSGVCSLVLALALASLCWSFGRDLVWQLRTG